jgi:hypothetical protein
MSCAKGGSGSGPTLDYTYYIDFINNRKIINATKCKANKGFLPSFTPTLYNLSITTSATGAYVVVYVNGCNFLPNGTTFVQFSKLGYIKPTYYSSFNLSFVVPLNALPDNYQVRIINLYNENFSPTVNQSYAGNLNYSNSITYTIT